MVEVLKETKEKWADQLKKIILASIGGAAMVQDEVEDFIKKCVERGQLAEKDGKKLISDLLKRQKKGAQEKVSSLESTIDTRIETILGKMHIPTRDDVTKMNEKLEQVLSKLEKLDSPKAK